MKKAPDAVQQDEVPAVARRLQAASADIMGEGADDPAFLHVILSQVCLPYRQPKGEHYHRTTGRASLVISAGHLMNPRTRKMELQGLPHGSRPRLLMAHLCTQAVRLQSPYVPLAANLTAFMRELGIPVTGGKEGSINRFKEQMNRLTAAHMQFAMDYGNGLAVQHNPAPVISEARLWFPSDPKHTMPWPTEVKLSAEFFESLLGHALPIDPRAYGALGHSARALDIYTWLAHRLPRVKETAGVPISWLALQRQFGPDTTDVKDFKREAITALQQVLAVYPAAKVERVDGGLRLFRSEPAIARKASVRGGRIGPLIIEPAP